MKKLISAVGFMVGVAGLTPGLVAGEAGTVKQEKKPLRTLAGPEAGHRVFRPGEPMEKETVTFLGVETAPASATLAAQLNFPEGAGLVVHTLVPDTAAAKVLQVHDIILKFEDQLLVGQRQLSVLIRQRKAGDEVTLTVVRGGKSTMVKVTLGSHEVPKISRMFDFAPAEPGLFWPPAGRFEFGVSAGGGPESEQEVDHLLRLIQRGHGAPDTPPGMPPPPTRVFIDRQAGPGFRAMTVHPGNSNMVYSDEHGTLELTIQDGQKNLVAKDPQGAPIYAGPVTTPEERAAMPDEVRARLEKMESMQDVTFETDESFRGAETKIVRPLGRGVSWHESGEELRRVRPAAGHL